MFVQFLCMCMFMFMFMCVCVHVQCWSSSILFEFILCVHLWFCCSLPVGPAYRRLMCALSDQRLSAHLGLRSQPSGRAHISSEDTQACQAFRVMWPSVLQADWLTAVVWGWGQLNVVCRGGVSVLYCNIMRAGCVEHISEIREMVMTTKWKSMARICSSLIVIQVTVSTPGFLNWLNDSILQFSMNQSWYSGTFSTLRWMAPVTLVVGLVWSS